MMAGVFMIPLIWMTAYLVQQEQQTDLEELLIVAEGAMEVEDYGSASDVLREIIRIDPHHVGALHTLARLYATASEPKFFDGGMAVELALLALDDAPEDPEIIDTLAMGYFALNKFERAVQEILRCIALNPYEPYYARQLKKFAKTWLGRLDIAFPNREVRDKARARFYLGRASYHLNLMEEAARDLEVAFKIGGPEAEVCLYLAKTLNALGDSERAIEVIQSLEENILESPELLSEVGLAFQAIGNPEGALICFKDAYDLDPDFSGLRMNLGKLYLDQGKHVKAVIVLKEALEHLDKTTRFAHQEEAQILFTLGMTLAGAGELEDGMQHIFDALQRVPDLPEAEKRLQTYYIQRFKSLEGFKTYFLNLGPEDSVFFVEAAQKAGLDRTGLPAFGDFDGDGDSDLLLSGSMLFENDGQGRFTDVTDKMGLSDTGGVGGIFGDYDNDGDLDIFVLVGEKRRRDRLYRNEGRRGFKDISEEAGHPSDLVPSQAAAFGDLNIDGYLDLYLANGSPPTQEGQGGFPDSIFLGGEEGRFVNGGSSSGIGSLLALCARGVTLGDYDNDGDLDIFVANDRLQPNRFFHNEGDGSFTERARTLHLAGFAQQRRFGNTLGAVFGDVDGDGDLDLFVANRAEPRTLRYADTSMLYINQGRPDYSFLPGWEGSGLLYGPDQVQPAFADVNNDGHLDLYVVSHAPGQIAMLYLGGGDGTFSNVTWLSGVGVESAQGCAFADVDGDGDQDLFVAGQDRPFLFLNQGSANHWVAFRLMGRSCNGTAIGARITVDYESRSQVREISGGRGFACQDDMTVHMGLGTYNGRLSVSIQWPDGRNQFMTGLKADKIHILQGKK
jgi:tetratricopeptide (TPR) repeat protein